MGRRRVPPTPTMVLAHAQRQGRPVQRGPARAHLGQAGQRRPHPGRHAGLRVRTAADAGGRVPDRAGPRASRPRSRRSPAAGSTSIMMANSGNWKDLVAPGGSAHLRQHRRRHRRRRQALPAGHRDGPPGQGRRRSSSGGTGARTTPTGCCARRTSGRRGWPRSPPRPGSTAVPGELDSGIGPLPAHAGARSRSQYDVLPVAGAHAARPPTTMVFLPLSDQVRALVGQVIPFPTARRRRVAAPTSGCSTAPAGSTTGSSPPTTWPWPAPRSRPSATHPASTSPTRSSSWRPRASGRRPRSCGTRSAWAPWWWTSGADDSIDVTVVLGADALGRPRRESTTLAPAGTSSTGRARRR